MSTALEIIKGSLRKIGVIATGEALNSDEANDALRSLNSMLSSWNTQKLIMLGLAIEEFSLIPGQNSYTFGAGGDFNTSVPVHVNSAFIRQNGVETPIEIIDNKKWGRLPFKEGQSDIPQHIYLDYNYPLRKVYLYPTPSAAYTLILHSFRKISSIASLSTELSFPDGMERAVEYNLSIELAPEYGKQVPAELAKVANESLANIKRVNIKTHSRRVDSALLNGGGFDWRKGE